MRLKKQIKSIMFAVSMVLGMTTMVVQAENEPEVTTSIIGGQISDNSFLFGINTGWASDIYGVRATLSVSDAELGFGGDFLCNSDLNSYNLKTWGIAETDIVAEATDNENEYTLMWQQDTPIWGTEQLVWSNICIRATNGSDVEFIKLELLDSEGENILITGSYDDGGTEPSDKVKSEPFKDAKFTVADMRVGWNLGNALDSCGSWISGDNPFSYECGWGNLATTKALISEVKAVGFNAVRVPVTWYQHIDENGNINAAWMDRVKTVVNYVLEEDMYCIINIHHDTGAGNEAWLRADETYYENNKKLYAAIWMQIANEFSDYGGKLLFEGYNEMLDGDCTWTNPKEESGYEVINKWAQLFVDTVRATGGKNRERNLIVNTYGSDSGEETVSHLHIPKDIVKNHLIAEVHIYTPDSFTSSGEWVSNPTDVWSEECAAALEERFEILDKYFIKKGIPVIVGEFAAQNKGNEEERAKYAAYFVEHAGKYGITAFWWDDGNLDSMGIINRGNYEWMCPLIKDGLIAKSRNEAIPNKDKVSMDNRRKEQFNKKNFNKQKSNR